jgi:Preprotein translocase subunit SecA (ATPase, RNA helicase)
MGLYTWLVSKIYGFEIVENRIWLSKAIKYEGIYNTIAREIANPNGSRKIFVVAHFEDCLEQLQITLDGFDPDLVKIIYAGDLVQSSSGQDHPLFLIAERHPFYSHDDRLLQFSKNQPGPCRLRYHLSLEDVILKRFVNERTNKILSMLGMEKNQPIQSEMVDYRLGKELKKIAKTMRSDLPARSAEEWLERNTL